jgi:GNAT superfamily N-acetyltransferase
MAEGEVPAIEVTLRDGSAVRIRGVGPDDRDRYLAGWERFSAQSRVRRFFTPMPNLSESLLDYFIHADQVHHIAIAAMEVAEDGTEGPGLGVARCIRLADDPGAAELAVGVVDDWQGRGLGSALVDRVVELARERGFEKLTGEVLDENWAMRTVFDRRGATWTRGEPGAHHFEIPLS